MLTSTKLDVNFIEHNKKRARALTYKSQIIVQKENECVLTKLPRLKLAASVRHHGKWRLLVVIACN